MSEQITIQLYPLPSEPGSVNALSLDFTSGVLSATLSLQTLDGGELPGLVSSTIIASSERGLENLRYLRPVSLARFFERIAESLRGASKERE